jgi:microcystin-dependent protein
MLLNLTNENGYFAINEQYFNPTGTNVNNFVLPNLQQRLPVGKSISNVLGATGGNASIILTSDQLPQHSHSGTTNSTGSHSHTATDSGHSHNYQDAYFAENLSNGSNNHFGTSANMAQSGKLVTISEQIRMAQARGGTMEAGSAYLKSYR